MSERSTGEVTRRKFLRAAGVSVAGLSVAGSVGLLVNHADLHHYAEASEKSASAPAPLTYVKLDPDKAAERGYQSYFKGG
jgi:hypothetical protein